MISNESSLKEINEVYNQKLINTYKSFIEFCEKNELKFLAGGGTLIGAVRHKGLIPWDDDIDILMPRADYNKFLSLKDVLAESDYEIIDWQTEGYNQPFAKFCDKRTTVIPYEDSPISYGIFIDIFPLDHISGTSKQINRKCFFYRNLLRTYTKLNKLQCMRKIIEKIVYRLEKKWFVGEKVCSPLGVYKDKEICPQSFFDTLIKASFEDTYIYIPCGYHEYLTQVYGDYMKLPPIDKQISHHAIYYVNFSRRITPEELKEMPNRCEGVFYKRKEMENAYKY